MSELKFLLEACIYCRLFAFRGSSFLHPKSGRKRFPESRFDFVSLSRWFYFDAVSGPQPGSFLLHGQKKPHPNSGHKKPKKRPPG